MAPPPPRARFQLKNFAPVTERAPLAVRHLARSQRSRSAPMSASTASSGMARTRSAVRRTSWKFTALWPASVSG